MNETLPQTEIGFVEIGNIKYISENEMLTVFRNYLKSMVKKGIIPINEDNEGYFKLIKVTK